MNTITVKSSDFYAADTGCYGAVLEAMAHRRAWRRSRHYRVAPAFRRLLREMMREAALEARKGAQRSARRRHANEAAIGAHKIQLSAA